MFGKPKVSAIYLEVDRANNYQDDVAEENEPRFKSKIQCSRYNYLKQLTMTVVLCLRYGESEAVDAEVESRLADLSMRETGRLWSSIPSA